MGVNPELRQGRIGGSEAAAAAGCDDECTPFMLWATKKGEIPPPEPTLAMRIGKAVEQGIIALYSEITGHPTRWLDETEIDPRRDFMAYTVDALWVDGARGVDAKWVSYDQRHRWGPTVDDLQPKTFIQMQWYMEAKNLPFWDIAALIGRNLVIFTLERDREVMAAVLEKVEQFWRRYLIGGERPPVDASDAASDWLKRRFPRQRAEIRTATDEEVRWLEDFARVRAEQKAVEARRMEIENHLKEAVGDSEGLVWPNGRFTWKRTKDRFETNWEALAKSLLDGFAEDEKAAFIQQHTETRHGFRRIWFASDWERDDAA